MGDRVLASPLVFFKFTFRIISREHCSVEPKKSFWGFN